MPGVGAAGVAAITAAGALVSQGANAYATGRMNKKNRKWNEEMYRRQRNDALVDWNTQNEYNSPVEQMKRLKAAGLNPNLVYGDGANSPSANIRSADPGQPKTEAPQFSNIAGETISKYFEVTSQKQQLKNMEATEALIKAQTQATLANAGIKEIDLDTKTWQKNNIPNNLGYDSDQPENMLRKMEEAKYNKTYSDAEAARAKAKSAFNTLEIQEMTKQTSVDLAVQKLIQMRKQGAKTDQETKNLEETYRILKANGTIAELDAEFAGSMNKRWDNYLIKVLGLIFGGK